MIQENEFIITEDVVGLRLDKAITVLCSDLSRNSVQQLIDDENILVNGVVTNKKYSVKINDVVTVFLPEPKELSIDAENIPLDIVYEDEHLLVVNKPKGMVVHPAAGNYEGTLVNALMYHCKGSLSGINGVMRPGIVHRIDKDTSGLLLVAKTNEAHLSLSEQIKNKTAHRHYICLVHGIVANKRGIIDAPIGRHPIERKQMAVNYKNGKNAVTHYKVLQRFAGYTYVECRLETGRTHQIRVHMASIGHPLLGDAVYGPKKCPFPKLEGQTLHAMILGFVHPAKDKYIETCAPLPEYFTHLLNTL